MPLESWTHYSNLKQADRLNALPVSDLKADHQEWMRADAKPRIVSLRALHQLRHGGKGLVLLPAYAQTKYIYDQHRILEASPEQYQNTPAQERLNQFDRLGASYREDLNDIFIEYRLGCVVSDAAAYASEYVRVAADTGEQSNTALLVIDGLRTVDATFALASANPEAIETRLLALPGKSAHNKGMAVDLTLAYWNVEEGCWREADMRGHMDHPDMTTNHRNYKTLTPGQQHNRLQLERVMLRAALTQGILLAPLREEFWDFRFPEDGLDFWRVLESVARILNHQSAQQICAEAITHIHQMLREGHRAAAYEAYDMTMEDFARVWLEMFDSETTKHAIKEMLGINSSEIFRLDAVLHSSVNVIYDADLPAPMQQTNPKLKRLFT